MIQTDKTTGLAWRGCPPLPSFLHQSPKRIMDSANTHAPITQSLPHSVHTLLQSRTHFFLCTHTDRHSCAPFTCTRTRALTIAHTLTRTHAHVHTHTMLSQRASRKLNVLNTPALFHLCTRSSYYILSCSCLAAAAAADEVGALLGY